ncbi:MAG: cytidine deaminase, partial [Mobilitalea sp.]
MVVNMQNEQDDRQKDNNQMNSLIPQQRGEVLNLEDLVGRTVVKNLILEAIEGMKNAYAPYSHYKVGAAVLTSKQKVYRGCNVENAAYGSTNCAERTAIFKAISDGERDFVAIAIVGGKEGVITELFPPCGT